MKKCKVTFIFLYLLIFILKVEAQERNFVGEGSDTLMGVGARYIAMGGASVAISNDIYAIYGNVANLAKIDGFQISISKQVDSELIPVNFLGAAFTTTILEDLGISTVIAFAYIPRLHFRAEGEFSEDEFESLFIRYALPSLPADFSGTVESKTKDYRLGFAFSPVDSDKWSIGFTLGKVDCASFSCGANATSEGVTMETTEASAYTFSLGGSYQYSEKLNFGIAIKDIYTRLDIRIESTDQNGTITSTYKSEFPTDITIGALYDYSDTLALTADLQTMFGSYGNYDLDVNILRLGTERKFKYFAMRLGLLVPIRIKSSKFDEIDLQFPVAPTIGLGWNYQGLSVDLAAYTHPVMSIHEDGFSPSADLSISYQF